MRTGLDAMHEASMLLRKRAQVGVGSFVVLSEPRTNLSGHTPRLLQ